MINCPNSGQKCNEAFQRFSDATSMHGFHELYYAKSWFWKIVWLLILIAAVATTIYQCNSAIYEYVYQSSSTLIQPASKSETYYPPIKLCIPHWISWLNWTAAYSRNFTKEQILWSMSYLFTVFSSEYFNRDSVNESFFQRLSANNINNVYEFYNLVAKSSSAYIFKGITTNQTEISFDLQHLDSQPEFCYVIPNSLILNKLELQKQSMGDNVGPTSRSNYLQFTITNWKFNTDKSSNKPAHDPNSYQIDSTEYKNYLTDWIQAFGSLDTMKNLSDINMPLKFYADGYTDTYFYLDQGTTLIFSIYPSAYKWKSTPQSPCKSGYRTFTADESCSKRCHVLAKHYFCGCLDVNFVPYVENPHLELCKSWDIQFFGDAAASDSFSQYESLGCHFVGNYSVSLEMQDDCNKKCEEGCETWTYDTSMTVKSLPPAIENVIVTSYQTIISIEYPADGGILIMIETDSQSWETFVGNVGGLLGIWTGASILSLFQIFYLCCCDVSSGTPFLCSRPQKKRIQAVVVSRESSRSDHGISFVKCSHLGNRLPG